MRKRVDRLFKSGPLFLRARAMRYHCRPSPFTASARYVAVYFLVLGKCVRVIQQCFSCLFVVVAVVAFTIPYLARPEPRAEPSLSKEWNKKRAERRGWVS